VIPIGVDLACVEHDDDQGSYATQTVEDLVVALGLKDDRSFVHEVRTIILERCGHSHPDGMLKRQPAQPLICRW